MDFVAPDRRTESLAAVLRRADRAQRAALQAVAMDMWPAYIRATRRGLAAGRPEDRLRSLPHHAGNDHGGRHRAQTGTSRLPHAGEASPLTRTKYLWFRSEEHLPDRAGRGARRCCTRTVSRSVAPGRSRSRCARCGPIASAPPSALLRPLVRLGHSLTPRAGQAGRRARSNAISTGVLRYCAAPDHQRRGRRPQQQDHEHQAQGRRLPQPRSTSRRRSTSIAGDSISTHADPGSAQILNS